MLQDLSLESYANMQKMPVSSRNDVYTATYDGSKCVLKEYDLLGAGSMMARCIYFKVRPYVPLDPDLGRSFQLSNDRSQVLLYMWVGPT